MRIKKKKSAGLFAGCLDLVVWNFAGTCSPNVSLGTIREGQGLETLLANCPDFAARAGDSSALRLLSDLVSSWGALMGSSCTARDRPLSDSHLPGRDPAPPASLWTLWVPVDGRIDLSFGGFIAILSMWVHTYPLFDVPFDRSQSVLPVPVFNNSRGSHALQHNAPWDAGCVPLLSGMPTGRL